MERDRPVQFVAERNRSPTRGGQIWSAGMDSATLAVHQPIWSGTLMKRHDFGNDHMDIVSVLRHAPNHEVGARVLHGVIQGLVGFREENGLHQPVLIFKSYELH